MSGGIPAIDEAVTALDNAGDPGFRVDGRNRRSADSKRAILAACRELMISDTWRPAMAEACRLARRSLRTGFQHFVTVEALHREALQDGVVRDRIAMRAIGPGWELLASAMRDRIVRCLVLGSTA